MSFDPSLDALKLVRKADGIQKYNSAQVEDMNHTNQFKSSTYAPKPQVVLSETDTLFFDHMKKRLELLNKRRHTHPLDIIKFIRSKVSFGQILSLHDKAELNEMDYQNQLKMYESRFQKLEKMNE